MLEGLCKRGARCEGPPHPPGPLPMGVPRSARSSAVHPPRETPHSSWPLRLSFTICKTGETVVPTSKLE